jgi:hypothetical protein
MLSLKELRLANNEKTTTASAVVASGSTCTSLVCRSLSGVVTGAPPKGPRGGKKGKGGKKQGGWHSQGNGAGW